MRGSAGVQTSLPRVNFESGRIDVIPGSLSVLNSVLEDRVMNRRSRKTATCMLQSMALAVTLASSLGAQQPPPVRDSAQPRPQGSADPLQGNRDRLNATSAQARTEQDQFERNHRSGLRFYNGGADARCDVDFGGNLCYWNNNGDVPPPEERNDAKIE